MPTPKSYCTYGTKFPQLCRTVPDQPTTRIQINSHAAHLRRDSSHSPTLNRDGAAPCYPEPSANCLLTKATKQTLSRETVNDQDGGKHSAEVQQRGLRNGLHQISSPIIWYGRKLRKREKRCNDAPRDENRKLTQTQVSDAPSYHSTVPNADAVPIYTPRRPAIPAQATPGMRPNMQAGQAVQRSEEPARFETIGLPPVPAQAPNRMPPYFNFPMSSATDTPTTRHYRKVAERRVVDGRYQAIGSPERQRTTRMLDAQNAANAEAFRPLEDPYLVGEQAAAEARRERLAREGPNASLQQEERQWDWLIGQ